MVIDDDRRVVGVVSLSDILAYLVLRQQLNQEDKPHDGAEEADGAEAADDAPHPPLDAAPPDSHSPLDQPESPPAPPATEEDRGSVGSTGSLHKESS